MPESLQASAQRAVFLSYASQDARAARRIAEALRAAGVVVWFDEAELNGGDIWDARIKQQIRDCALFLPIVSAQTQSRLEGYFRREWRLAAGRTHDMASMVPFLVPVVIDDTPEKDAAVPEEFSRAHWIRLQRALPTPEFVTQIEHLLAPKLAAPSAPGRVPENEARRRNAGAKQWSWAGLVGAIAVVAGMVGFMWRSAPAATPLPSEKSIAVLPFENLSDEKSNAFFADGMQEEILTILANIGDLHVVSRTSVLQYRPGTNKDLRQIASELGVAYILEGSVQRAGDIVRVNGQLINARTDEHIWAKSYTRDLKDVFAIQSALATEIASSLQAVLSPRDKARILRVQTGSSEAYDLYLRAEAIRNQPGGGMEALIHAASLLQSAVDLDPKFAAAWGELALVHVGLTFWSYDPAGNHLEMAQEAAANMQMLAPDEPDTWIQLAKYYAAVVDYVRAEKYIRRAAEAQPNNSWVVMQLADVAKWHGRVAEALGYYRKAYELDRQNPEARARFLSWLEDIRRYDEAAAIALKDAGDDGYTPALLSFLNRGSTKEMDAWFEAHPSTRNSELMSWKVRKGDAPGFIELADDARRRQPAGYLYSVWEVAYGAALMSVGETQRAREVWAANLARWKAGNQRDSPGVSISLAFLGDKKGALTAFDEFTAARSKQGVDPDFVADSSAKLAILVRLGERDKALAEAARLLKIPVGLNVHDLRHNLFWQPLQGDPEFEALLNDPKNNAPLI